MNSFIKRKRILLLAIVLCLISLHLAISGRSQEKGDRFIENLLSAVAYPFQAAFSGTYNGVSSVWNNYIYLVELKGANDEQKDTILRLIEENNTLREALHENRRLKDLLSLKDESSFETVAAKVLTYNIGAWTKTVKINRGERDGVADDMPLISPEGMVGRVIRTSKRSAEALLITDPRSSIDVMLQRTRVRAVAEGDGSGGLILKYIRDLEDIRIGDKVVTAGLSGIFPRKLPVGIVTLVEPGDDNFFKRVFIKPHADILKLEEVLVAKTVPSKTNKAGDGKTEEK